jgi:hypothetical protein
LGYLERQRNNSNNGPLPSGCYIVKNRLVDANGELLAELDVCPLCNRHAERCYSAIPANLRGVANGYDCLSCGEFVIEHWALASGYQARQEMGDHSTLPFLSGVIREITEKRRRQRRKYTLTLPMPVPILVNNLISVPDPPPGLIGIAELLDPAALTRNQSLDKALLNLNTMTDHEGQWIQIWPQDYPLAFAENLEMFAFSLEALNKQGLIRCLPLVPVGQPLHLPVKVQLTDEGLARVEELNANGGTSLKPDEQSAVARSAESKYTYDVALSFAGPDREYVEHVADLLTHNGVAVFYDKYEEADLWGKNLYTHLSDIYSNKSRYCVMFVSQHYAERLWTNHERQSAQERAFRENEEYILPVRLDDTPIPGLLSTISYAANKTPEQLARMILQKIGNTGAVQTPPDRGKERNASQSTGQSHSAAPGTPLQTDPPYTVEDPESLPWLSMHDAQFSNDPQVQTLQRQGWTMGGGAVSSLGQYVADGSQYVIWKQPGTNRLYRLFDGYGREPGPLDNIWLMRKT